MHDDTEVIKMKRTAIVLGSIAIAVLCLLGVGRFVARAIQAESALERKKTNEETQTKLRGHDAEIIEKTNKMLGEGGVFVMGERVNKENGQVENVLVVNPTSKEEAVVELISWAVPIGDYDKLRAGMGLEEVRGILDLSALRFIPNGANCRFVLVCRHGETNVTLVFAGSPDVKLVSKAIK
jgi:hypothetical protein